MGRLISSGKGFSLLELLITVAVFAITVGVGIPSYMRYSEDRQLEAATTGLERSLLVARTTALTNSTDVYVKARNGDWQDGWFVTTEQSKTFSECEGDAAGCYLLERADSWANVAVSGSTTEIAYEQTGESNSASFELCLSDNRHGKTIQILRTGRPFVFGGAGCSDDG